MDGGRFDDTEYSIELILSSSDPGDGEDIAGLGRDMGGVKRGTSRRELGHQRGSDSM